jgi:methyl-accepting chemotaxis protein
MGSISSASKRIAEITGVIDGIAFQTNILALNAAVEAARAGEHGRGFAVVAGEVRNLAQRASAAAKEIAALIQESASSVNAGEQLVGKAGGAIRQLVDQVSAVADVLASIRNATVQQSSEIQQINQAITAIDSATIQNATLVEESTAAAHSLREQADSLALTLGRFRVAA